MRDLCYPSNVGVEVTRLTPPPSPLSQSEPPHVGSHGGGVGKTLGLLITALFLVGCRPSTPSPVSTPPTPPAAETDMVVTGMNRGVSLMGQYDYAGAVDAFEEVVRQQPDLLEARVNLAIALFNRGRKEDRDLDRTGELLEAILQQNPDHLRALYFRGVTLQHLGDAEASLPYLEKVVQQRPDDGAAWYLLGVTRQRLGQPAEAALLEAIARKPYLSSAYYKLSQLAMLAGDTAKAGEYLEVFKRLRESPLSEVIELPQYGAMGDLALVRPLPAKAPDAVATSRYRPGTARVLHETNVARFDPGNIGMGLAGAAAGDLNGDGVPDLVVANTAPAAQGTLTVLLSTSPGTWKEATATVGLADVRGARSLALGDFDNDEVTDLFVAGATPHLFRGATHAPFTEVTSMTGITGGNGSSTAALFLDADHDGDLDLWVGQDTAAGSTRLFNNNADGTFTDLALTNGLALATAPAVGVLSGDLDGDRDFDLVLLARGAPVRIFLNDLLGQYTVLDVAGLELRGDLGGVLQDFNGDGILDLVLLGGEPAALRFYAGDGRGRFQPSDGFAGVSASLDSWGPLRGLRAADVDLDGDLDLAVFGREGHLLLNDGRGRFVLEPQVWKFAEDWALAGVELLDLTGDLVPDLLCLEQGAGSRLTLVPGELTPPGTALALAPTGVRGRDKRTRSPASGFGVTITLRSAWREQVRTFTGVNGGANQSVVPAVFGLGGMARADYAQLLWPDGVAQVEVALTAAQVHRVAEIQRKISSCPVLFAWNGERFEFITDFAGVGGLGYFVAPGECAPPQVLEHVKIEPRQLRPRDGMFELRVTEPMEEAAYVDRLELWAIDHPASVVVYPDERLAVSGPPPTHEWLAVADRAFPVRAMTPSGEDCRDRLLEADRRYAYAPPLDRRFIGFCEPHSLELDFGDPWPGRPAGERVVLFLHGCIEYPYSQTVYAAGQAAVAWEPIRVEGLDTQGNWQTLVADAGAPGGMGRMMTIELGERLSPGPIRLRLTTNLEIYYDQAFLGRPLAEPPWRKHRVPLADATLRRVGFPREVAPNGGWPLIYSYDDLDATAPFHVLRGDYTRYGEVAGLLAEFDDRYVIMGPGDEIALRFPATALPPLGTDEVRSFVLVSHAYCKDMDLYTTTPQTLEPLPFRAMTRYPYPAGEQYPDTPEHRSYRAEYNTRGE